MNYFDLLSTEGDDEGTEEGQARSFVGNGSGGEIHRNGHAQKKKKKKKKTKSSKSKQSMKDNMNGMRDEVSESEREEEENGFQTVSRKSKRIVKSEEEKRKYKEQEKAYQEQLNRTFEASMLLDNWDDGEEGYSGGAGFGSVTKTEKDAFGANKGKALQHREVEKRAYRMEKRNAQRQGLEASEGSAQKLEKPTKPENGHTNNARSQRIKSAHLSN